MNKKNRSVNSYKNVYPINKKKDFNMMKCLHMWFLTKLETNNKILEN